MITITKIVLSFKKMLKSSKFVQKMRQTFGITVFCSLVLKNVKDFKFVHFSKYIQIFKFCLKKIPNFRKLHHLEIFFLFSFNVYIL